MSYLNLNISSFSEHDYNEVTKGFSYKDIELLKNKISCLDESHHTFILKIVCDFNIEFSENINGCFINMLNIPDKALAKIEKYVNFLIDNEHDLKAFETFKESIQVDNT